MAFNFYETHTLLMAVEQLNPPTTFLKDRYFPTNGASDIFFPNFNSTNNQNAPYYRGVLHFIYFLK